MRTNEITVKFHTGDRTIELRTRKGRLVKELLQSEGIRLSFPCGGNGRCGKCRGKFVCGAPKASEQDRRFLSETEIESGVRLLCRCVLTENCEIVIDDAEEAISAETIELSKGGTSDSSISPLIKSVSTHNAPLTTTDSENQVESINDSYGKYGIAIDIGTTTIAMALVKIDADNINVNSDDNTANADTGNKAQSMVVDTISGINHQRQYGADVISRISAASEQGKDTAVKLRETIINDIEELITKLLVRNDLYIKNEVEINGNYESKKESKCDALRNLCGITICGNTTMLHLLRGYDVSGLGKYPYEAQSLEIEEMTFDKIIGDDTYQLPECTEHNENKIRKDSILHNTSVTILPGFTAFVGADILSGIYALDITNSNKKSLFVDLGTNGEIAYWNGKELKVTSTAAGPVFEGGGISCGVASVPGAISHVTITPPYEVKVQTIADEEPIGLCGTGVLEAISELIKLGIVDKTGLLADEFFEKGFPLAKGTSKDIVITQQDIRNVQLAKAAIYAGIKTILDGDTPDIVYLAGGFGTNIDIKKIMNLGMFPLDFGGKIVAKGNTALKGCIKFIEESQASEKGDSDSKASATTRNKLEQIRALSKEVVLAEADAFDEEYIEAMNF